MKLNVHGVYDSGAFSHLNSNQAVTPSSQIYWQGSAAYTKFGTKQQNGMSSVQFWSLLTSEASLYRFNLCSILTNSRSLLLDVVGVCLT